MEKAAAFNERVEVKALRPSLHRPLPVHVRRLLFFGRTFVIPEIFEAVASKDGWEHKGWRLVERVTVDPQFAAIPQAASASAQQAKRRHEDRERNETDESCELAGQEMSAWRIMGRPH
jgi:hypothetical protein